jgi:hypothetical protein
MGPYASRAAYPVYRDGLSAGKERGKNNYGGWHFGGFAFQPKRNKKLRLEAETTEFIFLLDPRDVAGIRNLSVGDDRRYLIANGLGQDKIGPVRSVCLISVFQSMISSGDPAAQTKWQSEKIMKRSLQMAGTRLKQFQQDENGEQNMSTVMLLGVGALVVVGLIAVGVFIFNYAKGGMESVQDKSVVGFPEPGK